VPDVNREIRLAAYPNGAPQDSDFELAETPVPSPADGQVLVRNVYISVDPYMRGRMNKNFKSYVAKFELGEPMQGGAVGQVVESKSDALAVGDWVNSMHGWREYYVEDGGSLMKIDPNLAPVSTALGVLGLTGFTAYVGLLDFGRPKEGETVFVSAASGAVGSIVGQIAKLKGCRAIGSAGTAEKVDYALGVGFDEVFNYREEEPGAALDRIAPDGIDINFENVGGSQMEAVLARMNEFGRIALCGMISQYNEKEPPRLSDFLRDMGAWVREGKVTYRETVVDGIENAPRAFMGLLQGENLGKMLVKVGPDAPAG
jgi:NADPH-dependent curcumin reductase CurA